MTTIKYEDEDQVIEITAKEDGMGINSFMNRLVIPLAELVYSPQTVDEYFKQSV